MGHLHSKPSSHDHEFDQAYNNFNEDHEDRYKEDLVASNSIIQQPFSKDIDRKQSTGRRKKHQNYRNLSAKNALQTH